ncbi:MAG: 23S rRNA (uracil(1939)-C(5))-methyltransferase RlmD [Armatimonadota bacterium]|nr:23S rRNA (uracil(1939)-C(5))-methyltransferase RlmD [Armatimonadota bacterium]MDR7452078.1 23S rRNA (uracil(1939)-C(5))-methyltransferase RlmD [Armatimonadota bacterium]MDR7466540.1 23S rRNA (uracil(1939)-C(5))-methyltransferase RlmD [Armatimonadota bacterium]MDR7493262.1 23S rRNA (uracil(1939)-C(5))-methyltransferase RlmD [Armatimonadota bacterium]MDR7499845.1 23S rRNA (uracil(1939)-C(5))-methyltransferase RlmD [Armatimonadota bacterium]
MRGPRGAVRRRDAPARRRAEESRRPRAGQQLTVTFRAMDPEGPATAPVGNHLVAVPFAIPGEEAVVRIVRGGDPARGRIAALLRKSPQAATPRCRHFGLCGGCQWQHLSDDAQRHYKVQLVRDVLARLLEGTAAEVLPAVGGGVWRYRNRLQAVFAVRRDRVVAGYHGGGEDRRVINIRECPIQQAGNVAALEAVREVVSRLRLPIYDHVAGGGLMRGVIVQGALATGETMIVLSATDDLPDRMEVVRAIREAVPGVTSLYLSVQPRHSAEPLGRVTLLWGRPYIEDEIAGLRLRLYPEPSLPPNPGAIPVWLEAIAAALAVRSGDTVLDVACEDGLVPLWLASRAARVVGIAPTREAMHRAWEHAQINGVHNCVFYTRAPERVTEKLRARGERFDAAVVTSRRRPTSPEVFAALGGTGVRRLAVAGTSLRLLERDLWTARAAGFAVTGIQPVDLLPQTSRVHCVVALRRAG